MLFVLMYTFIIIDMRLSAQRNSCPKRTYDLVQIWRDGGINKELKRGQVGQLYSALVGVDGSQLWRKRVDSDES